MTILSEASILMQWGQTIDREKLADRWVSAKESDPDRDELLKDIQALLILYAKPYAEKLHNGLGVSQQDAMQLIGAVFNDRVEFLQQIKGE